MKFKIKDFIVGEKYIAESTHGRMIIIVTSINSELVTADWILDGKLTKNWTFTMTRLNTCGDFIKITLMTKLEKALV